MTLSNRIKKESSWFVFTISHEEPNEHNPYCSVTLKSQYNFLNFDSVKLED
jgi:hypothetical protein